MTVMFYFFHCSFCISSEHIVVFIWLTCLITDIALIMLHEWLVLFDVFPLLGQTFKPAAREIQGNFAAVDCLVCVVCVLIVAGKGDALSCA